MIIPIFRVTNIREISLSGIRTHQHTGRTSLTLRDGSSSRNSKNYFSDVTFNYFYSDSRIVPRIKADLLTPVSSAPLVYSWCICYVRSPTLYKPLCTKLKVLSFVQRWLYRADSVQRLSCTKLNHRDWITIERVISMLINTSISTMND